MWVSRYVLVWGVVTTARLRRVTQCDCGLPSCLPYVDSVTDVTHRTFAPVTVSADADLVPGPLRVSIPVYYLFVCAVLVIKPRVCVL